MPSKNEFKYHSNFTGSLIAVDGTRRWFINGLYGRHENAPSIEYADGGCCYYLHPTFGRVGQQESLLHRLDGPAVTYADGTNYYYRYGLLHRDPAEGPAVIHASGKLEYWVDGMLLSSGGRAPKAKTPSFVHDDIEAGDGDHPIHEWRESVIVGATVLGYTDWLSDKSTVNSLSMKQEAQEKISPFLEALDMLSFHYQVPSSRVRDDLIIKRQLVVLDSLDADGKEKYVARKIKAEKGLPDSLTRAKSDNEHAIFKIENWVKDVKRGATLDGYVEWVDCCSVSSCETLAALNNETSKEARDRDRNSLVALKNLSSYYDVNEEDVTVGIVFSEWTKLFGSQPETNAGDI